MNESTNYIKRKSVSHVTFSGTKSEHEICRIRVEEYCDVIIT
jgi:hypothetical protein